MIKSVTTGLCILALSGTLAFAQSDQSHADTGPTSPTASMTRTNPINSNAMMKKHHIHKHPMSKSGMSGGNMPNGSMSGGDTTTEGMRNGIGMAR